MLAMPSLRFHRAMRWALPALAWTLFAPGCARHPPAAPDAVAVAPDERARQCLRAASDALIERQRSDGSFAQQEARWWQAGFAVRAWVGAHRILGDERYLAAAVRTMDRFADEQQYHGGWCAWFWDSVPADMRNSYNTADIGSISACLAILAPHVDPERTARYLAAQRRYLESFLPRFDLGDGSFSNGWFDGTLHELPYSVATATQAVNLTAFYQATGEKAFLRRAEQAASLLVTDWKPDGRAILRPHDVRNARMLSATQFHDLYYLLEGILWVFNNTEDETLRDATRGVLTHYLQGEKGLLAEVAVSDPWTEVVRGESVPKSRGMLGILCGIRAAIGRSADLDQLIDRRLAALCLDAQSADTIAAVPPLEPIDYAFAALSLVEYLAPQANALGDRGGPR